MSAHPPTPRRSLPMPLIAQGGVEALVAALVSALAVIVVIGGVWLAGGLVAPTMDYVAQLCGQAWLLLHGVPAQLTLEGATTSADTVSGTLWLAPWGLTLLPLWLGFRAGRRLARASYTDQLWQALLGAGGTYGLFALLTSLLVSTPGVGINPVWGTLIPALLHGVAVMVGVRREAGSWERLIGVDLAATVARRSQYSRWAGSYAWSVVRAGWVGLLSALAISALLLAVQIGLRWSEILQAYEALDAGIWGGIALTLVQLGLIPNGALWALAWTTGAGFAVGEGTVFSPLGNHAGEVPALPLLAALPPDLGPTGWVVLLLPVLAGVLAGWWLLRAGENHLDEWLSLKIPQRWASLTLSTLALGVAVGLVVAVLSLLPLALSGGTLGLGTLTHLGPHVWASAGLLGALIGGGAMVGYLISPLWERYRFEAPAEWLQDDDAA